MKYFMLIFISSVIVFSSCADVTSVNYDEDDPVEAIDVTTEFIKFCDTLLMDCNNEYNLNPAWENLRLKEFVGHHLIIENFGFDFSGQFSYFGIDDVIITSY